MFAPSHPIIKLFSLDKSNTLWTWLVSVFKKKLPLVQPDLNITKTEEVRLNESHLLVFTETNQPTDQVQKVFFIFILFYHALFAHTTFKSSILCWPIQPSNPPFCVGPYNFPILHSLLADITLDSYMPNIPFKSSIPIKT